jgi:uncharacterized protein (UPF0333 family)
MAYPTVSAPYGLKPVNLIGGQVYAGSTRLIPIASAYGTDIFYGDVVKLASSGTIQKDTGTTTVAANGVAGIFMGCTYTNPSTKQPVWSQYWPASTVASDAQAYVVDDPDVLFKVAAVSGTTVVAYYGQTVIGNNVSLVQNSGSTTSGDSAVAIDGTSAAATASLPIRIVAGVPDTANASGEFCEFICKFNAPYIVLTEGTPNTVAWNGGHMYNNPTGV